ncbi:hypothetical protein PanWU01x14_294920 [Parasponia andersonii]|uniref:Uncharacterized protein n=1 Tax=Parasponia andersonii TaxID=3476 RepID=A0A2P5AVX7_PARAD|nr:hypothetical protein PanWU01x14_294920 [Parasponia andersonii]
MPPSHLAGVVPISRLTRHWCTNNQPYHRDRKRHTRSLCLPAAVSSEIEALGHLRSPHPTSASPTSQYQTSLARLLETNAFGKFLDNYQKNCWSFVNILEDGDVKGNYGMNWFKEGNWRY